MPPCQSAAALLSGSLTLQSGAAAPSQQQWCRMLPVRLHSGTGQALRCAHAAAWMQVRTYSCGTWQTYFRQASSPAAAAAGPEPAAVDSGGFTAVDSGGTAAAPASPQIMNTLLMGAAG